MNLLDALVAVRGVAALSPQMQTKPGKAALKVVDAKIRSLQRTKAWRNCQLGEMPPHATDPSHPLNAGVKFGHPPDGLFPVVIPMYKEPQADGGAAGGAA